MVVTEAGFTEVAQLYYYFFLKTVSNLKKEVLVLEKDLEFLAKNKIDFYSKLS